MTSCAYVSVRRGGKRFLPLLRSLCALPEWSGTVDNKEHSDLLCERFAMLHLTLLHAIALLGGEDGFIGLKAYAGNPRRPISLSAQMMLSRLKKGKKHNANVPQMNRRLY